MKASIFAQDWVDKAKKKQEYIMNGRVLVGQHYDPKLADKSYARQEKSVVIDQE